MKFLSVETEVVIMKVNKYTSTVVVVVVYVANQPFCTWAPYDSKWLLLQIDGVKNKMEKQPGMHSVAQPWY